MAQASQRKTATRILKFGIPAAIMLLLVIAFTSWCNRYVGDECICCRSIAGLGGPYPSLGGRSNTAPFFLWMPEGFELLLQTQKGELELIHPDEGNTTEAKRLAGIEGYLSDVTRDGQFVALGTSEGVAEVYTLSNGKLIATVSNASRPRWSPDGETLAIGSWNETHGGSIELISLDAIQERRLIVDGSRSQTYHLETWSRLGDYLVLTATDPDPVAMGLAEKIYLLSLETKDIRPMVELAGCQQMLAWSPVNDQTAFAGNPNINWDLFQTELDERGVQNLTNTEDYDEYQPAWSPDGRSLAYVAFKPTSDTKFEQDIYVLDLVTLERRRLTYTPDEHESLPLWSPDGSRIAYLSVQDNNWYLSILNRDGSGKRRLVEIGGTP